jgi:Exodeoxyribonuclease X-like C-terminal
MSTPDEAKQKAASTYNAASDFYDHPVNTFWERYGRRTVERLALAPGAHVLDTKFPFGKYRGKRYDEIAATDPSYLQWIVEKSELEDGIKHSARHSASFCGRGGHLASPRA